MNTDRREFDAEPSERQTLSILRRPNKPTAWSITLTTWQLVALSGALVAVLKFGSEFHWRFWAQERVQKEVNAVALPIEQRLTAHEAAFVTKLDFERHAQGEAEARESLTKWLSAQAKRIEFIYEQAYLDRFGRRPPAEDER